MQGPSAAPLVALAVCIVGWSGCITHDTHAPRDPPQQWTDTTAEIWIVRTTGCGFCGGSEPWATTTALYADGHVVTFSYTPHSHSKEQTDPLYDPPARETDASGHVRTDARAAAHHDALVPVAQVLASYDVWNAKDKPIHIASYTLGVLSSDDRDAVRDRIGDAIDEAQDPGDPNYDCVDCAGIRMQALGEAPMDATLYRAEHPEYGNVADGDPWDRIEGQMRILSRWVAEA